MQSPFILNRGYCTQSTDGAAIRGGIPGNRSTRCDQCSESFNWLRPILRNRRELDVCARAGEQTKNLQQHPNLQEEGRLYSLFESLKSTAQTASASLLEDPPGLPALPGLSQLSLPGWFPLGSDREAEDEEKAAAARDETESRRREEEARKARELAEQEEGALKLLLEQAERSEAVQLMKRRAEDGSLPGRRKDSFKLGLVVAGGGMRGAVSGGALQALHDLGFKSCFDSIYGSSAGAINATYFLADQREGVDVYSQDITNTQFIDLKRLLKKKDVVQSPALDLSFLLDHVMDEIKPLDWQAVVDSPIPLKVVASCLDTLQPVILEDFDGPEDLKECLRASAAVPVVAGDPITHRGRRLVDAAVFEGIPFRAAIADGCTHIIALPTRPPFKKADYFARWVDDSVAQLVKKAVLSPEYMKSAWRSEVEYQKAFGITPEELLVESLQPRAHKLPALAGCHVFPIFPGPAASYSPMCIDAATVMLGIAEGRLMVYKVLGSAKQAADEAEQTKQRALVLKQSGARTAPVTAGKS